MTEGKLALWKSDLTRPLIWTLWKFVEELKSSPEKYVEKNRRNELQAEEINRNSGSWGTDCANESEENVGVQTRKKDTLQSAGVCPRSTEFRNSLKLFQENNKTTKEQQADDKRQTKFSEIDGDNTYANYEAVTECEEENTYANFERNVIEAEATSKLPAKNTSKLHTQFGKSLAEQLQEQLLLRNAQKPAVSPKPNVVIKKSAETTEQKLPQRSFLHNVKTSKRHDVNDTQKRMNVPPPPEPKRNLKKLPIVEQKGKDLPKPPVTIRNLDLVANLPIKTEESEDEYEVFDERIIQQHQTKSASIANSKLESGHQSSVESIYQPPNTSPGEEEEAEEENGVDEEEEEETYEIYESITEDPEDDGYYLNPIIRPKELKNPPPLPSKPPNKSATPSPTPSLTRPEKKDERSPDKKSATLPHSGSDTSIVSIERASRPLPPPPDKLSYLEKPWFHNITREQATVLIREPPEGTYGNSPDGYFLLRPSTSNPNNPLALVLWYKDRVYNVPVRKRADNRYALGTAKLKEQSFVNVEEIVTFYTKEELVLHTGGVQAGSTRLTNTPAK